MSASSTISSSVFSNIMSATTSAVRPLSVKYTASTYSSANMAASIVRSTTSLGDAYHKSFDSLRPLVLMGGGSRSQVITTEDLEDARAPPGEDLVITHKEYVLVNYQPLDKIVRDNEHDQIVCRLPLSVVCPKLQTAEIRDLAKVHEGISAVSQDTRRVILDRFNAHECTDNCETSYAVLTPVVKHAPGAKAATTLDIESSEFAGTFKLLPIHLLRVFLTDEQASLSQIGFKVKRVI
ncbi:hypothetical protein DFP72DRAFT_1063973 [Ephemerocybe angulata]|uniref:Uncharacterized protein n=1 Tax=Ephemerocybe angulata TaxID=980116 RepID=A0A8H6I854_9AGAR|nr:hypothetical protein DFP72DRAFT_1063973 [Tulosesus angulatus]